MPQALKRARAERGITLLESLVAILILAIAVLGMLGAQLRTLADMQTSVRREQAIRLIEDFAERIKSNPDGFKRVSGYASAWNAPAPAGAPDCHAAPCAPADLAGWDVLRWKQSVAQNLPLGQAALFVSTDETDAGNRRQLGVMVGWRANERRRAGQADAQAALPLAVDTGAAKVECPAGLICHLVYVQP